MERASECRNSSSSHSVAAHYSQTLAGLKRLIMGWMGECWGEEKVIVFLFSHFIPLLAISLHIYPCTNTTSHSMVFIQHSMKNHRDLFSCSWSQTMQVMMSVTAELSIRVNGTVNSLRAAGPIFSNSSTEVRSTQHAEMDLISLYDHACLVAHKCRVTVCWKRCRL